MENDLFEIILKVIEKELREQIPFETGYGEEQYGMQNMFFIEGHLDLREFATSILEAIKQHNSAQK